MKRRQWNSTLPVSTKGLSRGGKIAPKKRTASERERVYGTAERQAWLRAMPCLTCGRSPVELAHTANGGISRKADADTLVPLCPACHQRLHDHGAATFEATHGVDLRAAAARLRAAWEARCAA